MLQDVTCPVHSSWHDCMVLYVHYACCTPPSCMPQCLDLLWYCMTSHLLQQTTHTKLTVTEELRTELASITLHMHASLHL